MAASKSHTSQTNKTAYSKVSVKSQTVLPRAVRERLRIEPGDRLRYLLGEDGVRIERAAPGDDDGPFATFTEWASEADDAAYASL